MLQLVPEPEFARVQTNKALDLDHSVGSIMKCLRKAMRSTETSVVYVHPVSSLTSLIRGVQTLTKLTTSITFVRQLPYSPPSPGCGGRDHNALSHFGLPVLMVRCSEHHSGGRDGDGVECRLESRSCVPLGQGKVQRLEVMGKNRSFQVAFAERDQVTSLNA